MGKKGRKQLQRETDLIRQDRMRKENAFEIQQQEERTGATERRDALFGDLSTGYKDFAETGGITPEYEQSYRQRASGGVPRLYAGLQENLNQRKAIQGGYAPGYGGSTARMARQMSQEQARAARDAELGLTDIRNKGKLQGLAGLGGLYESVPGETADIDRLRLAGAGTYGNQAIRTLGPSTAMATRPGLFGNVMRGVEGVAGVARAFRPKG